MLHSKVISAIVNIVGGSIIGCIVVSPLQHSLYEEGNYGIMVHGPIYLMKTYARMHAHAHSNTLCPE